MNHFIRRISFFKFDMLHSSKYYQWKSTIFRIRLIEMQSSKYFLFQVCTTSNVVQFLNRVDIKNLITSMYEQIYIYVYI